MANKQGGLLANLGKRMLGFSTPSNGCCGAPGTTDQTKGAEATGAATKVVEVTIPAADAQDAGCCAPSCCSTAAPAGADARPSA